MKSVRFVSLFAVFPIAAFLVQSNAQINDPPTGLRLVAAPFPQTKEPGAVVVALHGVCEFAKDGSHFHSIKQGQFLPSGSLIRTKETGQLDIYFKRTGV